MKYFFSFFIILYLIRVEASELPAVINHTLNEYNGDKETLYPNLIKIESLLKGTSLKNPHAVFLTEFLNFTLKNPLEKSFNRYPFKKNSIINDIKIIEGKVKSLNPLAKFFAERIILEMKNMSQKLSFKDYLNVIKKSYYFSSKELKVPLNLLP